jgi:hypothetical protein
VRLVRPSLFSTLAADPSGQMGTALTAALLQLAAQGRLRPHVHKVCAARARAWGADAALRRRACRSRCGALRRCRRQCPSQGTHVRARVARRPPTHTHTQVYALSQAGRAQRDLTSRATVGKLLLRPDALMS